MLDYFIKKLIFVIQESAAHSTVGLSLLRTTMMMLELDFMSAFSEPLTDSDPTTLYFGGSVIVLLVAFVLLMPILLINLLVGISYGIKLLHMHNLSI